MSGFLQRAVTCSMFTRTGSHDLSFNPGFAEWTLNDPLILATANDMSEDSKEVREELLFA